MTNRRMLEILLEEYSNLLDDLEDTEAKIVEMVLPLGATTAHGDIIATYYSESTPIDWGVSAAILEKMFGTDFTAVIENNSKTETITKIDFRKSVIQFVDENEGELEEEGFEFSRKKTTPARVIVKRRKPGGKA